MFGSEFMYQYNSKSKNCFSMRDDKKIPFFPKGVIIYVAFAILLANKRTTIQFMIPQKNDCMVWHDINMTIFMCIFKCERLWRKMISHFPFEMRFSYSSADRGLVLKTRGMLDRKIENGYHTIEVKEEEMNTWKFLPKTRGKGAEFL